jgi:hypothetical protein
MYEEKHRRRPSAATQAVDALLATVQERHPALADHVDGVRDLARELGRRLGLRDEALDAVAHAAALHDVGKVAIPDAILLKPGPLTAEERAIVETHAEEGYRLLRGSSSSILDLAASIALSHHEKWDGSGYPRGLERETIPIEGRIVAIADVFDALTSDRVYRGAYSIEKAIEMMREQRGLHFDPVLLDAFLDVLGRSGADARAQLRSDPQALLEQVRKTYATALERGDAETAEGAIAQAIEDGIAPATLHAEVIEPALSHIGELHDAGTIDAERERRAMVITRRILTTVHRYLLGGAGTDGERLLASVEASLRELDERLATREHALG